MVKLNLNEFFMNNFHWFILIGIILVGIYLRTLNWIPGEITAYDPQFFYRYTEEILSNNFISSKWDFLSFAPHGRPVDFELGWSYTIALFHQFVIQIKNVTVAESAGFFVALFASLSAIPAYFLGKQITNIWGGLATAFFVLTTIIFLSVSYAGYTDTDTIVVFYTLLTAATTIFAIKKAEIMDYTNKESFIRTFKKYLIYLIPAIIAFWLFAFNWNSSWYIYFIFLFFIPILIIFRVIENLISNKFKINFQTIIDIIKKQKNLIFAIILIGILGEAITLITSDWPFNTSTPHYQLVEGLNILEASGLFLGVFIIGFGILGGIVGIAFGKKILPLIGIAIGILLSIILISFGITGIDLIVNQSVAELQPITSLPELISIMIQRIGIIPIIFAFSAFAITFIKLIFRKNINNIEYFIIIWFIISLLLATKGVRFTLLLSIPVIVAAGFTIGNILIYVKKKSNPILLTTVISIILISVLIHFNNSYELSNQLGGEQITPDFKDGLEWLIQNADKDSIIATWWDPGHTITGYTGLRVMADGFHCGPDSCIFYDHNTRITDMGRAFAISDENESYNILKKYTEFTDDQCRILTERFNDKFDESLCKNPTEMYILATSDLIYKYYWLSFFGTSKGEQFVQCDINQNQITESKISYSCYSGTQTEISLLQNQTSGEVSVVLNSPLQGIRNSIITDLVIYQNGQQLAFKNSDSLNVIDGLVWIDPSFSNLIFMSPEIRDSVFTNMFFFDGKGEIILGIDPLKNFNLRYKNSEMKIFDININN